MSDGVFMFGFVVVVAICPSAVAACFYCDQGINKAPAAVFKIYIDQSEQVKQLVSKLTNYFKSIQNTDDLTNLQLLCNHSRDIKEKWINATGREDDWYPTEHSAICSSHFEEQMFLPMTKSRRLFPNAVPTLKLRLVFDGKTPSTSTEEKINAKKTIIKQDEDKSALEQYRVTLQRYKRGMKVQSLKIKRLQAMVRRYRDKVEIMQSIMSTLKDEDVISEEHRWILESDAL